MDDAQEPGRLAAEARRLRVCAALLTLTAALLFVLASYVRRGPIVASSTGPAVTSELDATFHAALLEFVDGAWRVRPGSARALPTLGQERIDLAWESDESWLAPEPHSIWPAGAAYPRWRVPEWSFQEAVRPAMDEELERPCLVIGHGARLPFNVSMRGAPIPPERTFLIGGRGLAAGRGDPGVPAFLTILIGRLTTESPWDPTDVEQWRRRIVDDLRRCAEERHQGELPLWRWAREVKPTVALALVLAPGASLPHLARLRQSTEMSPSEDKRDTLDLLRAAEAVAGGPADSIGRRGLADIASAFEGTWGFLRQLATDTTQPDAVRQSARRAMARFRHRTRATPITRHRAPPWTTGLSWAVVSLLMIALALVAVRRPRGPGGLAIALRRDAAALLLALLACAVSAPLVGPITTTVAALWTCGLILAALRRDPRLRIRASIVALFCGSGVLLMVAEGVSFAWIDAAARAMVFAGAALLATDPLIPAPRSLAMRAAPGDSLPRRSVRLRRGDIPQWLFPTLGLATLLLAIFELDSDLSMRTDAWRLALAGGFVVALLAAVVLHVAPRGARHDHVPPAGAIAVTLGAALHVTLFVAAGISSIDEHFDMSVDAGYVLASAVASALLLVAAWMQVAVAVRRVRMEAA